MELYTSVDCYEDMARARFATPEDKQEFQAKCDRIKMQENFTVQEMPKPGVKTAGFGGNKTLMLVVGLGILYFVGKKQKWF